jgi:hypothetical protein
VWLWGTFVVGGLCLLLPLAGWVLLASRTGDNVAALAAVGQVFAILIWAVTWMLWRREWVPKQPVRRGRHQAGHPRSRRAASTR